MNQTIESKITPELASKLLNKWRGPDGPKSYFEDILGVKKIWKLQDEVFRAIPVAIKEHKHIYIASGHALGKDWLTAGASLWFLHTYSPSIIIQTAPTDRQVKKVMWGETMAHWNNRKIDLGGTPYASPYLEIRKEDWYLIGFTTKETGASREAAGGKFQGFHAPNIMVVVSEAQAVEDSIFDQIDAVTTSANVLVIFIGNPTRARGRFAKGLRDKENNIVFNFSCLENPNYKQRKTVIPGLCSYEWVEDKRRKWGEDDPRWYGRVLGQIPKVSISNVLDLNDIDLMKSRFGQLVAFGKNNGVSIDPAGEGSDYNEFMAGKNGEVVETFSQTNMAPSVSAIKAVEMCRRVDGNFIVIDCDGIGIGVYQELIKLSREFTKGIIMVKFHGSASPKEDNPNERPEYQNRRAEAAFVTQKRAREGKATINPAHEELIEDLREEEYFTNSRGLIQIEDKSDIKDRLDRSPGKGDTYKMLQWGFQQDFQPMEEATAETVDRQGSGTPVYDEELEFSHDNIGGY